MNNYVSLMIVGVAIACLACSSKPAETQSKQIQTGTETKLTNAKKDAATPQKEEAVVLPKRVKNVYEEPVQTKRAWAKRMLIERRFSKEMCGGDSFLLECIEEFRNPSTRVLGVFSKKECFNAVDDIVGKELNPGGKRGLEGAFYGNDLPSKLKAGAEMDIVAARMARRVLTVLLPVMRKHGARFKRTPRCEALRSVASDVDGN